MESQQTENEINIEIFKLRRLLKRLEHVRGNGTSLITLLVPPQEQMAEIIRMIKAEQGQAGNIQKKSMRDSVVEMLTKIHHRILTYGHKIPQNGLVMLAGEPIEKKCIDFIPWKKLENFVFKSDDCFHLKTLYGLIVLDEPIYGFIVIDGASALFATVQGNAKEILLQLTVNLPNKHNKGGQSSVRFARLHEQARQGWLKKVCEAANEIFLKAQIPIVKGLVLAGSADFKYELKDATNLEKKLQNIILSVVDVSYGGQNGLSEALQRCSDTLKDVQLNRERESLSEFYNYIARDDEMVVYGGDSTQKEINRIIKPADLEKLTKTLDENETLEKEEFVDWLAENLTINKGTTLLFVSDRSAEGHQFVKGFQGIAGILRYKMAKELINQQGVEYNMDDEDDDFI